MARIWQEVYDGIQNFAASDARCFRPGGSPTPLALSALIMADGAMNTLTHPACFGYGSLVNRATHANAPAQPACLTGWRRIWCHTGLRPLAFLSAEPASGTIDGLVAAVPDGDWAALDQREAAYRRRPLPARSLAPAPDWAARIEIYTIAAAPAGPEVLHPILLSYLDVVVQGFMREFGAEGVGRFFASTAGWGPILDDRHHPRYPRHQRLSRTERALVDDHLQVLGLSRSRG